MRIDKLLWFLRFVRSRSLAQNWVSEGHIRLNGRRVERGAQNVAIGDVLVLPMGISVRVVRIIALPHRRGPALEAQACYHVLDEALDENGANPLAAQRNRTAIEGDLQP